MYSDLKLVAISSIVLQSKYILCDFSSEDCFYRVFERRARADTVVFYFGGCQFFGHEAGVKK